MILNNIKKHDNLFENGYDSYGHIGPFYDCIDELDKIFDKEELFGPQTDEIHKNIMDISCDNLDGFYAR